MNEDQRDGKTEKAKGKVQEKWGELTDDPEDKAKGRAKQVKGSAQEGVGDAKEAAKRDKK